LVGDTGLQGVVVGADPVGGQHQHLGGGGGIHAGGHVQLADLAADDVVPALEPGGGDERGGGQGHAPAFPSVAAASASDGEATACWASAASRAMSPRGWQPSRAMACAPAVARARATLRSGPVPTTDSTRPPELTSAPSSRRAVPAWITCAPSCRACSSPPIASPRRTRAG